MSSQNDRSLVACLKVPDAPHLRPLAEAVESMAFTLKDEIQTRSSAEDRMHPVSAASMVAVVYELDRLMTLGQPAYKQWSDARRTQRGGRK
jgi:hypothetical protein